MKTNKQVDRLAELLGEKKRIDNEIAIIREGLMNEFKSMSEEDIALYGQEYDLPIISVKYVPATTRKTLDTSLMKKDGIYENYLHTSTVKESLRVNYKGD